MICSIVQKKRIQSGIVLSCGSVILCCLLALQTVCAHDLRILTYRGKSSLVSAFKNLVRDPHWQKSTLCDTGTSREKRSIFIYLDVMCRCILDAIYSIRTNSLNAAIFTNCVVWGWLGIIQFVHIKRTTQLNLACVHLCRFLFGNFYQVWLYRVYQRLPFAPFSQWWVFVHLPLFPTK